MKLWLFRGSRNPHSCSLMLWVFSLRIEVIEVSWEGCSALCCRKGIGPKCVSYIGFCFLSGSWHVDRFLSSFNVIGRRFLLSFEIIKCKRKQSFISYLSLNIEVSYCFLVVTIFNSVCLNFPLYVCTLQNFSTSNTRCDCDPWKLVAYIVMSEITAVISALLMMQ